MSKKGTTCGILFSRRTLRFFPNLTFLSQNRAAPKEPPLSKDLVAKVISTSSILTDRLSKGPKTHNRFKSTIIETQKKLKLTDTRSLRSSSQRKTTALKVLKSSKSL